MASYTNAIPQSIKADTDSTDPREGGNHIARLQVAAELAEQLNRRAGSIADKINGGGPSPSKDGEGTHMFILRFPDDIIASCKEAHIHLNRIEGALGV